MRFKYINSNKRMAWSISIHRPSKWKVITMPPDPVPYYGIWKGSSKDNSESYFGFYFFPFAFRKAVRILQK